MLGLRCIVFEQGLIQEKKSGFLFVVFNNKIFLKFNYERITHREKEGARALPSADSLCRYPQQAGMN